jgi:hypothetical protein
MEKMLRAEAKLQAYVQSGEKNSEQQKQLTDAVKAAMDKFIRRQNPKGQEVPGRE